MKNQAQFTPHQSETWAAALSVYDTKIVNRAILEQGLSSDPFPDLAKILLKCEHHRRQAAGTMPQGGIVAVSDQTLQAVAAKMQIEI
jgi:hypothetical protein